MRPASRRLACLAAGALAVLGCVEQEVTLTIGADGTCVARTDATLSRALVEKHILEMRARDVDEEEEAAPRPSEGQALSDQELVAGVKEAFARNAFPGATVKLEPVEVKKDKVRAVLTVTYPTVKDMVTHMASPWRDFGLYRTVVDADAKGKLRLTYSRPASIRPARAERLEALAAMGFKATYRFVLPGKVLESSLPNAQDRATWIAVDGGKQESVEAFRKVIESPVVITSEMGGLAPGDVPLDSTELAEALRRPAERPEAQTPAADAGPGFVAEAITVTTTTHVYFPEGKKLLDREQQRFARQAPGVVVRAKLHAPRGRQFLAIEGVRVLKATDDKGRAVALATGQGDPGASAYLSGGDGGSASVSFDIRFQLPEADAQAIEQIACETTGTTFGEWKRTSVGPLKPDPNQEIDLSQVLAGTRMTVTRIEARKRSPGAESGSRQGEIDLKITGPPEVRQLAFGLRVLGTTNANCYPSSEESRTEGRVTTRTVKLTFYVYAVGGEPERVDMFLDVRYPDAARRERATFVLKGLDLY